MKSLILVILFLAPVIICDRFIVGGQPIEIEDTPYAGAIFKIDDYYCTGALISHEFFITASHCVDEKAKYTIRIGSKDKFSGGLIVNVEQVFVHPKYNSETADYDFALMRLSYVEKFPDVVQFIPLPDENDESEVGEMMQIAGWGVTRSENEPDQYLRGALVPIYDFTECQNSYSWVITITDRMVCAGFKEGGVDTCRGDSGSGMKRVSDGVLIGITSFGEDCAKAGFPGVYAKISAVRDWIREIASV